MFFDGQEFAYVLIEDEPYFDNDATCKILGYANTREALRRLSSEGVRQIDVFTKTVMKPKNFINDENLYRLIGRSDKPEAKGKVRTSCPAFSPTHQ